MIDPRLLRDDPQNVIRTYREKLFDDKAAALAERAAVLTAQRLNLLFRVEALRAARNRASRRGP